MELQDIRQTPVVEPGTLYVVSTPIGNLLDITLRAIAVLSQVDHIAAEDSRTSRVLLNRYDISGFVSRYHDHNKERVTPEWIERLKEGQTVAIITDAGTPGISDPAFYLVRAAIRNTIPVVGIPGPTACINALVTSGLPTDRFCFEGFLPVKKGRQKRLSELKDDPRTLIFYESPYRMERTLADLYNALGDRDITIAREMTKKFEQIVRGTLKDIPSMAGEFPKKGEFVIVVQGMSRKKVQRMNDR